MKTIRETFGDELFAELVKEGGRARFLGHPVADLNSEDLLAILGHIGRDHKRQAEWRESEARMRRLCSGELDWPSKNVLYSNLWELYD